MPFLKEQIDLINAALKQGPLKDPRFQDGQFGGLAVTVQLSDENRTWQMPAYETDDMEVRYAGVDDTFPLVLYHRVLGHAYATIGNGSFGDGNPLVRETADMVLVVYGKRQTLQLTPSQLEALICTNFPDVVRRDLILPLKLDYLEVRLQSSNTNALDVFAQEYRGNEVFIGPEDVLFSIRYQIESKYRKGCFNICDCPQQ